MKAGFSRRQIHRHQPWYAQRIMSTVAEDILEQFDRLPEDDKHEVAVEILRRTRDLNMPVFVGSPRLVDRSRLSEFQKEIIEEPPHASVRL
jgi:hypothetical protein